MQLQICAKLIRMFRRFFLLFPYSQTSKILQQSDEHPGQAELKKSQVKPEHEGQVSSKVGTWGGFDSSLFGCLRFDRPLWTKEYSPAAFSLCDFYQIPEKPKAGDQWNWKWSAFGALKQIAFVSLKPYPRILKLKICILRSIAKSVQRRHLTAVFYDHLYFEISITWHLYWSQTFLT